MKDTAKKKVIISVAAVLGVLALSAIVIVAVVIKKVYFPPWRNYSMEPSFGSYNMEKYESHDVITENTVVRICKEKPNPSQGAVVAEDNTSNEMEPYGYFVFENLDKEIVRVLFVTSQNRRFRFDAYYTDGHRESFALYSLDWSTDCRVANTDIVFKLS